MGRQIGLFFLFVGVIVVFVFAASLQVDSPEYVLCLIGLASLMLGAFLIYRYRRRPAETDRFRLVGKMRNRKKKDD